MRSQDKWLTKIAFLGISFMLTSAYAINGALPQMAEALALRQRRRKRYQQHHLSL